MTQPRRGWATGGCSLTWPRGQGCQRCHTRARVPISALSEPEGGSASASACHLPQVPGAGRALTQPVTGKRFALPCVEQRRRNPPPGAQGVQMLPKLQQTNFPGIPGLLRSKATLPAAAETEGSSVPTPDATTTTSSRRAQPACFGQRGLQETLTFGWCLLSLRGVSCHSGVLAVPQPCQSCRQQQLEHPAHPTGSALPPCCSASCARAALPRVGASLSVTAPGAP